MGGTSIGARRELAASTTLRGVETSGGDTVSDTLLGPEGSGNRTSETDARRATRAGRFGRGPDPRRNHRQRPAGTAIVRRPARTLRTAQWTRASS